MNHHGRAVLVKDSNIALVAHAESIGKELGLNRAVGLHVDIGKITGVRPVAMVMEDPDAPGGTFRHLMMYDIPPACTGVPADVDVYTSEIRYADNDFGFARYDGPEPPPGRGSHRYRFRLMALDVPKLPLPHSAGAKHVLQEARKHMIAEAELIGCYER